MRTRSLIPRQRRPHRIGGPAHDCRPWLEQPGVEARIGVGRVLREHGDPGAGPVVAVMAVPALLPAECLRREALYRGAAILKRLTPDQPRRAPIRWHVATVRDARAESPTARTLVLDVPEWPGHHVDVRLTVQVRTQTGRVPD